MKQSSLASLAQIAIDLKVNKSKLIYYHVRGLLKPVMNIGGMNVFDKDEVADALKKIEDLKKKGGKLKTIKSWKK